MKHKPAHILEYAIVVSFGAAVRILPLRIALALGWLAAASSHFIGRVKVQRTYGRIRQVVGSEASDRDVRRIAWLAWRNLFFNVVEGFRFTRLTPQAIRKQPMSQHVGALQKALAERKQGYILATPHMGNWEIAAVAGDLMGLPIFAIARKQRNPLVNDYINRMRQSFNLELVFKETRMWRGAVKRIEDGKIMALLPDINVRRGGVTVDFLNNQATIAPGAAHFAQMAQCPVYPVVMRRFGWTRHDATLLDPVYPDPQADPDEDRHRIMQDIMSAFSREILKTPEQYFWHNKRWVLQ